MKSGLMALLMGAIAVTSVACQQIPPPPVPNPSPSPAPQIHPQVPVKPPAKPDRHVEDWLLPGSIGPLTTRLELETRFGKAHVREESFRGAEGDGRVPALVVFPDVPGKRLELMLDAGNPDAPVQEVRVSSPNSVWRTTTGLRTGMSLAELVALNGAPVSFYGLDWDYGGTVQDWHGGSLANAVGAPMFHRVTLAARKPMGTSRLPQGDNDFRSDDIRYPTIGNDLVVGELGISWPHEGED